MSNNDIMGKVQVTKEFTATKDALYKAWTDPEALKQWWKPMGKQLQKVANDIREGGEVRYEFEDGLQVSGTYKKVEEGSKLVYSWTWQFPEESIHNGDYLLTVEFNGDGDSSSLSVTQENIAAEHAIKPHEEGWNEALDALQQHLANEN